MRRIGEHLTYANVMATFAVFLVLSGGTAVALSGSNTVFSDDIVNGEVKGPDVGVNAVTSPKVADRSLSGNDLSLSTLQKWQAVLDVPIAELLVESDEILSAPVMERARLVRVMKTAATILEKADGSRIRRLADTLVKQLVEIMPELEGIGPWHEYTGPRRRRDECGRIAERQISPGLSRVIDSPDHAA